jgi:hypothetical protein
MSGRVLTCLSLAVLLGTASTGSAAKPIKIAPDGAWTWFTDERAVTLENGNLLVGYVRSDGAVAATNFNPRTERTHGMVFRVGWADDHNNPSFTLLPDGRVLAVYSGHGRASHFFWRVSKDPNPRSSADWNKQRRKQLGAKTTYANTYRLSAENNRIFNFHRAINRNPTLTVSDDLGRSWEDPRHFIAANTGWVGPYPRYASNGRDRIDLIYTDGFPGALPTSIYHLFYRDDAFRLSNGAPVAELRQLPVPYQAGSVIYSYSDAPWGDGEGPNDWIPGGRAWTWDIAYERGQNPVCVFQVRVSGSRWRADRIFYYYASWTGTKWRKRLIAQAGRPLYRAQRQYGAGIAIDPENPRVVYLSSNARRPFDVSSVTEVPLSPDERYQLYRARVGRTLHWDNLTPDGKADNLRPHAVEDSGWVVWFRGRYETFQTFQTRVVGLPDE